MCEILRYSQTRRLPKLALAQGVKLIFFERTPPTKTQLGTSSKKQAKVQKTQMGRRKVMHKTMKRLTNDDLAKVCGGQYIFRAFDPTENKSLFFVADQTSIFTCDDEAVARRNSPSLNSAIENCADIAEAERKANEKLEQLNSLHHYKPNRCCTLL